MSSNVTRECAQVRAGGDDIDAKRDVGRRESVGRPRTYGHVPVGEPHADLRDAHGPELTPWLLARIAQLTNGASIKANTALIVNNARVAGRIAAALKAASAG